jgi:hypothetical protein
MRHLTSSIRTAVAISAAFILLGGSPAHAQGAQQEDEAVLQLAEPDFRIINLPTTLRLPRHKGSFDLTHRFAGNLRRGSFSDQASRLFGIDDGATVGFEYRFAPVRRVQAAAYRNAFQRTIQLHGKYDAIHQDASRPLSISALASIEGTDNFQSDHAPALGAVASRLVGDVAAVYVMPAWVHNTAASIGADRDTFLMGVGGRLRIGATLYVAAEISPRLGGYAPGDAQYGFAIEKRAGGHMFQINFTNSSGSTYGQIARGGAPEALYLGFNLARKFF